MNTPNKITLSRLLLIPIIVFFYLASFIPYGKLVATVIFIIACLTDFLDGYLARKNNQVTTLGKFFDSIADKVLIMTGMLLIVFPAGQLPAVYPGWLGIICVIIILAREFIVSALRQIAAAKGVVLAADMGGKIKATAQYVVTTLYMVLAFVQETFLPISSLDDRWVAIVRFVLMILLVATTILTIYSGASYLIRNRHVFKEGAKEEEKTEEVAQTEEETSTTTKFDSIDPLFYEAAKFVIENQKATTTAIQRQFTIGYPRAARIVEHMEEKGIISEVQEDKTRKVLITLEELDKMN